MRGRQLSALDVLDGRVPVEKLAGKLVFVGPTLRNADRFSVPLAPADCGGEYREFFHRTYGIDPNRPAGEGVRVDLLRSGAMSGVEIHANVACQIPDGRYLRETRAAMPWLQPALIAGALLPLGWVFWQDPRAGKRRVVGRMVLTVMLFLAVAAGTGVVSFLLFALRGWVFVPLALLLAWTGQAACGMAFSGVQLRRQNQRIERMFGSAVGQELLEYIHAHPEVMVRNERRVATVLFSDIRGFTPLTERLGSDQIVELLKAHFECLFVPLADHGAWVDKYVGDLVMAAWNVLRPTADHALRAVRAAVAMKIARAAANAERVRRNQPPVEIGVGIHTGPLVGGNIGSRKRSNFTIIGDTVNLASRIEHEARNGEVLISEDTYRLVADHVVARALPPVEIRGKTGAYTLYEVLALRDGPAVPGKEHATAAVTG
jgi:adenylate cyclase